ncbi:MAG: 3-dehydroquinate synthase, partial [Pyrinomonadaceae bacterium]
MRRVPVRLGAGKSYEIEIGAGALSLLGQTARRALPAGARQIALISNRKVFDLYGAAAVESLRESGFDVAHWLMGDGERYKSLRTLERAVEFLSAIRLERGDAVVALGGGVVGDLAGFAAAVYLRGVAFIQVPTTLLAQIDSSVGGKTGVNIAAGKNLVGAFHQPRAVVIDTETLRTLPARELTAGWCEALKQGAVASRHLFEQTRRFLAAENVSPPTASGRHTGVDRVGMKQAELAALVAAQCAFKARIVARDERESQTRADRFSRRVLNFGHTIGHALEAVTEYRRFRHGEAVGYG